MEQYMWIVWLVLLVVMIIIEALGPALVSVWFAIGALVSMIVSFIPNVPWWVEVIVFFVISLVSFFAFRPLLKKRMKRDVIQSNVDSLVGKNGKVIEEIAPMDGGEIRLNDVIWRAHSVDDKLIERDAIVEVVSISGNKLIVKKAEEK